MRQKKLKYAIYNSSKVQKKKTQDKKVEPTAVRIGISVTDRVNISNFECEVKA